MNESKKFMLIQKTIVAYEEAPMPYEDEKIICISTDKKRLVEAAEALSLYEHYKNGIEEYAMKSAIIHLAHQDIDNAKLLLSHYLSKYEYSAKQTISYYVEEYVEDPIMSEVNYYQAYTIDNALFKDLCDDEKFEQTFEKTRENLENI